MKLAILLSLLVLVVFAVEPANGKQLHTGKNLRQQNNATTCPPNVYLCAIPCQNFCSADQTCATKPTVTSVLADGTKCYGCPSFSHCVNNTKTTETCPPNNQLCINACAGKCSANQTCVTKPTVRTVLSNGTKCYGCAQFSYCKNSTKTAESCPPNNQFCINACAGKCSANQTCVTEPTVRTVLSNGTKCYGCAQFSYCKNSTKTTESCPPNNQFCINACAGKCSANQTCVTKPTVRTVLSNGTKCYGCAQFSYCKNSTKTTESCPPNNQLCINACAGKCSANQTCVTKPTVRTVLSNGTKCYGCAQFSYCKNSTKTTETCPPNKYACANVCAGKCGTNETCVTEKTVTSVLSNGTKCYGCPKFSKCNATKTTETCPPFIYACINACGGKCNSSQTCVTEPTYSKILSDGTKCYGCPKFSYCKNATKTTESCPPLRYACVDPCQEAGPKCSSDQVCVTKPNVTSVLSDGTKCYGCRTFLKCQDPIVTCPQVKCKDPCFNYTANKPQCSSGKTCVYKDTYSDINGHQCKVCPVFSYCK